MIEKLPKTELDARFSSGDAEPRAWEEGRRQLERAEVFWISTVQADGSPHVTPLISVWLDGALFFSTGPEERKAKNIARNPRCALTTGGNALGRGLDVVVEGEAVRVTDDGRFRRVAGAYLSKYGEDWRFGVRDGAFYHGSGSLREADYTGEAWVFEVAPEKVFGFGRGEPFSQTRWRF